MSEKMHEVRTFAPCKAFYLTCLLFFSSLENYFGFRTTNFSDHSLVLSFALDKKSTHHRDFLRYS